MRSVGMGIVCGILALAFIGCGGTPGEYRKPTSQVRGRVLVDGQPAEGLSITCLSTTGMDREHPTTSGCLTSTDGRFAISTYISGDGVPEGDYILTYQWGTLNVLTKSYDGDKLNGRYTEAAASPTKFTVKTGEPVDLGEIRLTTK